MARDYNADYDAFPTWGEYRKKLNEEGMSDDQIESALSGTRWNTPGSKYAEWAHGRKATRDTLESRAPEAEQLIKAQTREQFANDNDSYRNALASKGVNPGNSTGKVRSIQQAYYDGLIDKGTRDYMMADSIAKFARNTGRDIGNIGAQYTGGAINNNYEEADWNKRNDELFKQQTSAEAGTIANSDKAMERRQQEANLTGKGLENEKANRSLNFSRELQAQAKDAYDKGNTQLGNVLSYMASKGATSLSYDELIALMGSDILKEAEKAEKSDNTPSDFSEDKIRKDYSLEEFKKSYPSLTEDDYNEWVRLVKENPGDYDAKKANAFADKRMKEEKAAKKQQEKEAKALKKQQEKEAAAAKVKSGYDNVYKNMIDEARAGNRHSLTQAYNNLQSGKNPFDGISYLTDEQRKAWNASEAKAKEAFANAKKDWKNPNGTPSDDYMATVLKYLLQSM